MSEDLDVLVRGEKSGTYKTEKLSECRSNNDIVKRNKRDWVADADGVARDAVVGEEWVDTSR